VFGKLAANVGPRQVPGPDEEGMSARAASSSDDAGVDGSSTVLDQLEQWSIRAQDARVEPVNSRSITS